MSSNYIVPSNFPTSAFELRTIILVKTAGICGITKDPGLPSINEPLDILYWSFVTGTTIGYGDFAPQTDNGKILTVLYALLSLQTTGAAADAVGEWLNTSFIGIDTPFDASDEGLAKDKDE